MKIKLWLNTKKFREIALIFLLSFLVFTWFKKDLVVSGGDFPFNFSLQTSFPNFFSVWNSSVSLGIVNIQALPHLFYQFLYYLASLVNFPLWLVQRILYYFLFVSGGLGVYLLIKRIFNFDNLFCLVAAVFYMVNPYSLVFVWGIPSLLMFAYAGFPILFFLFVRGLERRGARDIFWFCLAGLAFSAFGGVFSYVLILWFLLFFFLAWQMIFADGEKRNLQKLKFTLTLFSAWLLTNFYWLLPYLSGFKTLASGAAYQSSAKILTGTTAKAFLANSFRLFGYNVFGEKFMGVDPFFPYAGAYQSNFFIFLSFLIPLLIFLGIVFPSDQKRRGAIYFLSLALLSLFVYKGVQPPFGGIYLSLIERFPLLTAFRNPLDKIGPLLILSYAVLFGYSLFQLKELLGERKKLFGGVIFILSMCLFLIFGFPFWTGQVFYPGGKIRPSLLTKLPSYYYDLAEWLKKQPEEFRILPIPIGDLFGTPYDWEYGHGGADPLVFVLPKPIIYTDKKLAEVAWHCLIKAPTGNKNDGDEGCLALVSSLLNVKYVLVHYDIKEKYFNVNPQELKMYRTRFEEGYYKGIVFEKSFAKVDIYRLTEEKFLPRFYFPKEISYLRNSGGYWIEALVKELPQGTFFIDDSDNKTGENSYILDYLCQQRNCQKKEIVFGDKLDKKVEVIMAAIERSEAKVAVEAKKPGYFLLTAEGIDFPQFLVFSENYDQLWEAFQNGKKLNHFNANLYANAWLVEPPKDGNTVQIEVKYRPQRYYWIGLVVSLASFLVLFTLFGYEARTKRD